MARLFDITGQWNMSERFEFNDKDMWEGKFLLDEDGWFEGIVNDHNSTYEGDRFIFGIYHPGKVIELLKISPSEVSDPFVFRGDRDARVYSGYFSVISMFSGEHVMGTNSISTGDVETLKEKGFSEYINRDIDAESNELLNKIEAFKENVLDDLESLYSNSYRIKDGMSQYVLDRYEGKKFKKEDINEIVEPVREEVEDATIDGVKKLVRELDLDFIPISDDMPF